MTETGYFVDNANPLPANFYSQNLYKILTDNNVEIAYIRFWQNYEDVYTVPVPGIAGEEDFLQFVQKEEILLLNEIPDFFNLSN